MTVLFAIMLVKLFIGITQVDANFVQLIIQTVTGFASGSHLCAREHRHRICHHPVLRA
jgi:hypothetical protein